jgi:hypothetical protein
MSLNTPKSQDMDTKNLALNVDRFCERYMKGREKNTLIEEALLLLWN